MKLNSEIIRAPFFGHPTSMKSSDFKISAPTKQFERLGGCPPAGPEKIMETLI
jgi:hypothetical protein